MNNTMINERRQFIETKTIGGGGNQDCRTVGTVQCFVRDDTKGFALSRGKGGSPKKAMAVRSSQMN